MRRALALYGVISLVLSAAMIFGAVAMLRSLTSYRNPYPVDQDFATSGHGPALVQHVVLVVIDGLRVDTAQTMKTFRPDPAEAYRAGRLSVSQPSYSLPTWAAIGTGTTQAVTGVLMNGYRQPVISNIFAKVKAAGLTTAMVGGDSWNDLYGPWLDQKYVFSGELPETEISRRAADMAQSASLTLVYFPRTDEMGHAYGADSQQYSLAARTIDTAVLQLLANVDLTTTTVIVTADHGHVNAGGHGGPETDVVTTPLIIYGAAVKSGDSLTGRQIDIAPTIAALLGTGYPDFVQGEPLLDALDCTPLDRDLILAAWSAQVEQGAEALLPALGVAGKAVTARDPRERAEACIAQYEAAISAKAARDSWSIARSACALVTVAVALLISMSLRRYTIRAGVLAALAGLLASLLVALIGPLRSTFTTFAGPQQVILTIVAYAAAGLAVTLALILAARGRGRPAVFRYWAFGMIQVQVMVFGLALAIQVLRGPGLISGYVPDFGYWLVKVLTSAYAAIANAVMLLGLVPVWLICRSAAGSAMDSPTRIAPLPGNAQRP